MSEDLDRKLLESIRESIRVDTADLLRCLERLRIKREAESRLAESLGIPAMPADDLHGMLGIPEGGGAHNPSTEITQARPLVDARLPKRGWWTTGGEFLESTLGDVIEDIIGEAGRALTIPEITRAVLERGFFKDRSDDYIYNKIYRKLNPPRFLKVRAHDGPNALNTYEVKEEVRKRFPGRNGKAD